MTFPEPISCLLIVGGQWHDINFARLELLKLLAEEPRVRVEVRSDYEDLDALSSADFLISYTCNIVAADAAQEALRQFVERGGRWYALHGTNAILRMTASGQYEAPDLAPGFMDVLGTAFLSHPPIEPYQVEVTQADHPLTQGIEAFLARDELYLMDVRAPLQVLLHTHFGGSTPAFAASEWEAQDHPVLYLRPLGEGGVLYLTLGHCRGHYDMRPDIDFFPDVQRGSWDLPVFYELLRRGIAWAARLHPRV